MFSGGVGVEVQTFNIETLIAQRSQRRKPEGDFRSYLLTFEEALEKITVEVDHHVLDTAWKAWQMALRIDGGELSDQFFMA